MYDVTVNNDIPNSVMFEMLVGITNITITITGGTILSLAGGKSYFIGINNTGIVYYDAIHGSTIGTNKLIPIPTTIATPAITIGPGNGGVSMPLVWRWCVTNPAIL